MDNYLLKSDFYRFITETNLDGITESEDSIWENELLSAVEVAASYLRFRYDTDKEFQPFYIFDTSKEYQINSRVTDGTDLYYAITEVPANTPLTETDFWTKGDSRNPAIVQIIVVLVLYNIYSRLNGSEIPNWIQVLYDGGDSQQRGGKLGYLKSIRKGDVQINLSLLPEVENGSTQSGNSFAYGNAEFVVNRNKSI